MQVSLETLDGLQRSLQIELPNERLSSAYEAKITEMLPRVRIDGFRQGKVPARVVKQKYGQELLYDVANELVRETLFKAIEQESLKPAGMPAIDIVQLSESKAFIYKANFEILPDVDVKSLKGEAVEQYSATVTDADFDKAMQSLQKQHQTWEDVDRASADGDQVVIDFDGSIDGESLAGGQAEGFDLVLGSNSMIPGFEDGIKGAKAGEDKEITVTFPEDYHAQELAGKEAKFAIKVHKVQQANLPELNDELAKKFGEDSIDSFKESVKSNLNRQLTEKVKSKNKDAVFAKLAEINDVTIPAVMINEEIQRMKQQAFGQNEHFKDKLDSLPNELFADQAQKSVKLGLLLSEFIKANNISASADEVKAKVEEIAAQYDKPDEFVKYYYADQERLSGIENLVLEQKAFEQLVADANVTETALSFDEIMQPEQQQA